MIIYQNKKTKAPACCNLDCCGNKFGRGWNKKSRRYTKRAERNVIRKFINQSLVEE